MNALAHQATTQFYEWEILGRGWLLAEHAVDLEPPFTPFFGHFPRVHQLYDDGLHPTVGSRIASFFSTKKVLAPPSPPAAISYNPYPFDDDAEIRTLRIIVPKVHRVTFADAEQFLTMASYCTVPMSFELIATPEQIRLQFSCRAPYASYLKSQLQTLFADIAFIEQHSSFDELLLETGAICAIDFGMKEEFMRPLALGKSSHHDPLIGIIALLEHLAEGERMMMQILFQGVVNSWEGSMMQSVMTTKNQPFFSDAPEMVPMTKEKVQTPLFAVSVRAVTQTAELDESLALLQKLSFAITTCSRSAGNSLIPLVDEGYTIYNRLEDVFLRQSRRVGMLLNAKELVTFVHVPTIVSKKMVVSSRKTKAAPSITSDHPLVIGINEHDGRVNSVSLSDEQRLKHVHIIGATGTGKSTLMREMIRQDIRGGKGVAVLDPHGDLIEQILQTIPPERGRDLILLDPSDVEFPLAFNILHAHSDIEKEVLSSDLVAAFRKLSTSWGDQMNAVLANAILAFLESATGGTLIDLRRFLLEKNFRSSFLQSVRDPHIQYYWQTEYPLLKTNSIGPILTRLDGFLRPRLIRNMVAQPKGLDFEEIIDGRKILLVKVPQGLIGTENSFLLGSMVVSKLSQAAFARQSKENRPNFFVYIDEFHHFITPSMAEMLSGARKYHVGLTLAHQDLQQLQKSDADLLHTVLSSSGTRICFRLGDADAKRLAEGFSFFDPHDFQNLERGQAIAKVEKADFDFSFEPIDNDMPARDKKYSDDLIAQSRLRYCKPRTDIEAHYEAPIIIPEQPKLPPDKPKAVKGNVDVAATAVQKASVRNNQTADQNLIDNTYKRKEESQHRYLQNLIKKIAEANGFKCTLEASTPTGDGKVDVLLEKEGKSVAIEVCVTTDIAWEIHNLEKCLATEYDAIISCIVDKKTIPRLKEAIRQKFAPTHVGRITVLEPDAIAAYFARAAPPSRSEASMKGYRVNVTYEAISEKDMQRKRDAVARIVANALRSRK